MPINDLEQLRRSAIVSRIISEWFDGVGDAYALKVRAELRNGWLMDFWEHGTVGIRRYSFHVFTGDKMIVRWDNAPHHPEVNTFPHHKHVEQEIEGSPEMDLSTVLAQLEQIM